LFKERARAGVLGIADAMSQGNRPPHYFLALFIVDHFSLRRGQVSTFNILS
jgi:hypothetical protein